MDTLEYYTTDDGAVTKFIHRDGSETAIKCAPSQSTFLDVESKKVETRETDRNKYSIFISSSTGCYLRCPMCHLTIKDSAYRPLNEVQVLGNLKEAIIHSVTANPSLRDRYVKICWMGMGDALNKPYMVKNVTLQLLHWMLSNGYTKGLDSVDLSTVMPKVNTDWIYVFQDLNELLGIFPHNPDTANIEQAELSTHSHYVNRSSFRLFYSLHSAIQSTRDQMAPNTTPIKDAIALLQEYSRGNSGDLLFHQLFVEGLNDDYAEVTALIDFVNTHFEDKELRVLRYNSCDKSSWQEWDEVSTAVQTLAASIDRLKVQISAGKEVQAACGQFLVAHTKTVVKLHNIKV